jgi:hypothetical protein
MFSHWRLLLMRLVRRYRSPSFTERPTLHKEPAALWRVSLNISIYLGTVYRIVDVWVPPGLSHWT